MSTRAAASILLLAILGLGAYGYWQGTPQDVVDAVRAGELEAVRRAIARDPQAVHARVYPQAYERHSERVKYQQRTGRDPWEGRYVIHDAASRRIDPTPMLDVLAQAGADLAVRLNGRTLLHMAAADGNLEVAAWLIDRGADVGAVNECTGPCDERGQTPLHEGLAFREDEMSVMLLERGARADAADALGRTALHLAAARGRLSGAFALCRYGADPSITDTAGRTPYDLALVSAQSHDRRPSGAEAAQLSQWLKPKGGCAIVAESARAAGAPVSDDEARKVFAETVPVS